MSNNPFVNLAAASVFTIFAFGYLITEMSSNLLDNIAKHEAKRAEEFQILDRQLDLGTVFRSH